MGATATTILVGATITPTGGTNQNFTPDGVTVQNGLHLADAGEPNYIVRHSLTLKTRNPALVNGVYGKGKRYATLVQPIVLASGLTSFNVVRIEVEVHPEMASADYTDMLKKGAQLLIDSDLTTFWSAGSLA